jgi:hypothetical protein
MELGSEAFLVAHYRQTTLAQGEQAVTQLASLWWTLHTSIRLHALLCALALLGVSPLAAQAQSVLSDNLAASTAGTEAATGSTWLTASFATDDATYSLTSVTLLLANPSAGQARLDLYSDGNLEPGSLLGTLTSPDSYPCTLDSATFLASDITLTPNTTYWLVLSANCGEFDWAWTTDNTGSGAGFQHTWGQSDDAGVTWFTIDSFPTQFTVTATAVP